MQAIQRDKNVRLVEKQKEEALMMNRKVQHSQDLGWKQEANICRLS